MTPSAEQLARNMLERMGIEDAQSFTAGQLVALADLIAARAQPEQGAALAPVNTEPCPKCSSPLAPGHALESTMAPASHPDHLTDSTGRGTTLRPSGTARMVPVLKCPKCGYSRSPGPRSPA